MSTSVAVERLKVIKGHLGNGKLDTHQGEKRFRFSLKSHPLLTDADRIFYEENGYVVVRNLLPHNLLDKWSQRFRDICEGKVDKGRITLMKDLSLSKTGVTGERLYNKIQDFMWDEVLYEFISFPELCDVVECFTGPNMHAMHTMLINKPPDAGSETSRHPLHQDLHYFLFRPADRIVCAWTAMEKVTRDNGCLVVLPGTHRGMLQPHEYPSWENGVNKMYHGIVGFDGHNRMHLPMEKGDTVFFHPILVHGSGANRTKGFRKAISCHYAASECHWIDVEGTTQDSIAEEVKEIARKRGLELGIQDIWKYRSRLVRGVEVNLC